MQKKSFKNYKCIPGIILYKIIFMTPAIRVFHNTGSPRMLLKARLLFFFGLIQNLEIVIISSSQHSILWACLKQSQFLYVHWYLHHMNTHAGGV